MKLAITGEDLKRTDKELQEEFNAFLTAKRANPPRQGKAHAEWHDVVREAILTNPGDSTPRQVFLILESTKRATDVSAGITDQRIKIGEVVVSWDTFQAYCYRFRKSQQQQQQ